MHARRIHSVAVLETEINPVLSQIAPLACFEDGAAFALVIVDLPWFPWPFKDDREWPYYDMGYNTDSNRAKRNHALKALKKYELFKPQLHTRK